MKVGELRAILGDMDPDLPVVCVDAAKRRGYFANPSADVALVRRRNVHDHEPCVACEIVIDDGYTIRSVDEEDDDG